MYEDSQPNQTPETVMKRLVSLQPMLIAYAYAILGDWHEAEDVFQDAFLEIHRIQDRYDPEKGTLDVWARGIVRLLCKNRLKKRAVNLNRRKRFLEEVEIEFEQADPEEIGDELARQISAMRRCMAKLPPDAFRLLHDFYVKGMKGKELAEREDLNPNQFRSLLHRWKASLKGCIDRQLGVESSAGAQESYDLEFYPGEADFGAILHSVPENIEGGKLSYFLREAAFAYAATRFNPLVAKRLFPEMERDGEYIKLLKSVAESRISIQRRKALQISAIAAVLVLCGVGIFALFRIDRVRLATREYPKVELVIGKTTGQIHCIRGKTVQMLHSGDRVLPGDVLSIRKDGAAYLRFMPEGTDLRLFQGASVKFPSGYAFNKGKRLILKSGVMYADVRPQLDQPMVVETGGVQSVVKGTEFSLHAGKGDTSRLEVYEGAVEFKKEAASVLISAGEFGIDTLAGLERHKLPPGELERGLKGYWKFDGGSDSMLVDEVSDYRLSGHNLDPENEEGVVTFDGHSYAEAGDPKDFHFSGAVTISVWVKLAEPNDIRGILGKYDDEGIVSEKSERSYLLKVDDMDRVVFRISSDGMENQEMTLTTLNGLSDKEWTHVCAVYRPGESMELYLNGELENVLRDRVIPRIAMTNSLFRLGNTVSKNYDAFFFKGKLDELRMYDRGLSLGEVRELAKSRVSK